MSMKVLITGAAGNLGSILARHLLAQGSDQLRLMVFHRAVAGDLVVPGRSEIVHADLGKRETLGPAVKGIDVIIHFAGVLFKAHPEQFLSTTNTAYFRNLVDAANEHGVRKLILISFPHVEGPTTFDYTNEFSAPGGMLGRVASRVMVGPASEREANHSLARLKTVIERAGPVHRQITNS